MIFCNSSHRILPVAQKFRRAFPPHVVGAWRHQKPLDKPFHVHNLHFFFVGTTLIKKSVSRNISGEKKKAQYAKISPPFFLPPGERLRLFLFLYQMSPRRSFAVTIVISLSHSLPGQTESMTFKKRILERSPSSLPPPSSLWLLFCGSWSVGQTTISRSDLIRGRRFREDK